MQISPKLPDPATRASVSPKKRFLFSGFDPLSPVKVEHTAAHTDMLMDIDFGSLGDSPTGKDDVDLSHLRATISKMKRESIARTERLSLGGGLLSVTPKPQQSGDDSFDEPLLAILPPQFNEPSTTTELDRAAEYKPENREIAKVGDAPEPDVSMEEVEQALEVDITEVEIEQEVKREASTRKIVKRTVPMPAGFKPQRSARAKAADEPREEPKDTAPTKTRRGRSATQSPNRSSPRRSQGTPKRDFALEPEAEGEPVKASRGRSTTRLADRANAPVVAPVEELAEVAPKTARSTKSRMPTASNIGAPRVPRTRKAASVEPEEGSLNPTARTKRTAATRDQTETEPTAPAKRARQASVDVTDSVRGSATTTKRQIPTRMPSKSTRKPVAKGEDDKENTPEPSKPTRAKASTSKAKVVEDLEPASRSLRSRAVR